MGDSVGIRFVVIESGCLNFENETGFGEAVAMNKQIIQPFVDIVLDSAVSTY